MAYADYQSNASSDWREQLKRNEAKTRWVIVSFIALYTLLGLLLDVIVAMNIYHGAPLSSVLHALLTLQIVPYATLILFAIAGISLLVTFSMYDRLMLLGTEYYEITPRNANSLLEKQLYNVVEEMKVASSLDYMPKVYIIEADYMNAFASGYSEKSAMVAITRGLIEKLDRAELQAVMAHELSHIRHHDIKLNLSVAVLSNLMLIIIDVLFYSLIFGRQRREDNRLLIIIMILRYVLPLVTVLLTLFLSRTREYMADAGAVELMRDNSPMARALLKISGDHEQHAETYREQYGQTPHEDVRRASYIFDPVKTGFEPVASLSGAFSTHPSLEQRLKALGFKKSNKE